MKHSIVLHLSHLVIVILLIGYQKINNSYCGSYIPQGEGTCDQFTNDEEICCYLRGKFEGAYFSQCYPFNRTEYYTLGRTIDLNGYEFTLDCGQKRGALCGQVVNPINYQDCGIYSTKKNSCCYYRYKTTTNCVWLGTPDIGRYYDKEHDLEVICRTTFYKLDILIFLIGLVVLF